MIFSKKRINTLLILVLFIALIGLIYIFIPPKNELKRIGVLLYQKTPTTSNFVNGLKQSLAKQGYYQGKNLLLYVENLGNTSRPVSFVLKKLERQKVDLLITTGKELTVTVAHTIVNKPVIFALVSDPIRDETIQSLIEREKDVTGVSYFTPYDRTLELSKRIIPNLKQITIILPGKYTWSDLDKFKSAAMDTGIALTLVQVPLRQISQVITDLKGKTDAIYLPNDIQVVMERDQIQNALLKVKIPAISNNLSFQYCSVLTYFAEPGTMGEIAGEMVVKIFHGANTEFMPVELSSYFKLVINLQLMKEFKMNINKDVLSYANEVIQ